MPAWPALPELVCEEVVCWTLAGGSLAWLGNVSLGPLCVLGGMLGGTYATLDGSDKKALKDLAGLVAVADVLKCLGRVLAADVEHDLLTTGVLVYEAYGARGWLASLSFGEIVKDVLFFFWVGWGSDRKRRKRTGAVVDLVVDDHVEIFLQEESAPIAGFVVSL